jgi:hypothetical protein
VAFGAGCSDREDASTGQLAFPVNEADAIAKAALIDGGDLPGSGWTTNAEDDFGSDSDPFAVESEACREMRALAPEAADLEPDRAGRGMRELLREGEVVPVSVVVQVEVYRAEDVAEAAALGFAAAFRDPRFGECLGDFIRQGLGDAPGATVEASADTRAPEPPPAGSAVAIEARIAAGDVTTVLRYEAYAWQYENAFVRLTIAGAETDVTADLATAAIAALHARFEAQRLAP